MKVGNVILRVSFVLLVLAAACGGSKTNGDGSNCALAVAGCKCYPNKTCEAGYLCGADGQCTVSGNLAGAGGDGAGGQSGVGGSAGLDATNGGSAGSSSIGCEPGFQNCDNGCVNPNDNPLHCGGCDQPCPTGYVCEAGQCKDGGDCTVTPCSGFSYCDLIAKRCMPGCGSAQQCALNESCDLTQHTCVCQSDFHSCNGACVSNDSPETCGTSCTFCPALTNATSTCDGTNCGLHCNDGFFMCGNACYPDEGGGQSVAACGPNCTPCTAPANATAYCSGGTCEFQCNQGFGQCGNGCYSSNEIGSFCGDTCAPCPAKPGATASCVEGQRCEYTCQDPTQVFRCGRCISQNGGDPCNTDDDCCLELSYQQVCVDGMCQIPYRSCGNGFTCPDGMTCDDQYASGFCTIDCDSADQCPDYLPLLYPDIHPQCFLTCYMPCGDGFNTCPAGWTCVDGECGL